MRIAIDRPWGMRNAAFAGHAADIPLTERTAQGSFQNTGAAALRLAVVWVAAG
jgi:hypothetical protein